MKFDYTVNINRQETKCICGWTARNCHSDASTQRLIKMHLKVCKGRPADVDTAEWAAKTRHDFKTASTLNGTPGLKLKSAEFDHWLNPDPSPQPSPQPSPPQPGPQSSCTDA